MEKSEVKIAYNNRSVITGYSDNSVIVVTSNEGWYDTVIDVQTVPKMVGAGSYIVAENVAEKVIIVTFSIGAPISFARTYWTELERVALIKGHSVTITNTITEGSTKTIESLTGRIRSVKPKPAANESIIEVEIVCTNPSMTRR